MYNDIGWYENEPRWKKVWLSWARARFETGQIGKGLDASLCGEAGRQDWPHHYEHREQRPAPQLQPVFQTRHSVRHFRRSVFLYRRSAWREQLQKAHWCAFKLDEWERACCHRGHSRRAQESQRNGGSRGMAVLRQQYVLVEAIQAWIASLKKNQQ